MRIEWTDRAVRGKQNVADLPKTYHSVVIGGLSKMVYYIEEDEKVIYVAAFWDCRREPKAMAGEVKSGAKDN